MDTWAPNPWEDEGSSQASPGLGLLALPQTPDNRAARGRDPADVLTWIHSASVTPAKIYGRRVLQTSLIVLWSLVLMQKGGPPLESGSERLALLA